MTKKIVFFCLLTVLVSGILGCGSGTAEKFKIYVDTGGNQNYIMYSNDFHIDEHGFLTVPNPSIIGESNIKRAICSPGTYFIIER